MPPRFVSVAPILLLVAVQAFVLHRLGQPWIAADGVVKLWESDVFSPRMSQELTDWYSFSHIVHGFIFFWLLKWLCPRQPLAARLAMAVGIEVAWEIAENSPLVIQAYRKQALAAGYAGDSILNSISDTVMMALGFWAASRLPGKAVLVIALAFEIFTGVMIRDGLAFNLLDFALPLQSIHDWQAGAQGHRPQSAR